MGVSGIYEILKVTWLRKLFWSDLYESDLRVMICTFLGGPGEDLWKTDEENKVSKLNKGTVGEDSSHGFSEALKLNSPCEVRGLAFVTQHLAFIGVFQFFLYNSNQKQNGKSCWRPVQRAESGHGHSCPDC